jgi:hypothetical protein
MMRPARLPVRRTSHSTGYLSGRRAQYSTADARKRSRCLKQALLSAG